MKSRFDRINHDFGVELYLGTIPSLPLCDLHTIFVWLLSCVIMDKITIRMTNLIPGGLLLIGNFSPNHPDYTFIEGISEWYLIFRSEEEQFALLKAGAPAARHFVMGGAGRLKFDFGYIQAIRFGP